MNAFVDVARLTDIPPGAGLAIELSERHVALFRVDGRVFATDGDCVRCGAPLAAGSLDGRDVECAQCGWHYDVETGRMRTVPSLRLDTFDVRLCGTMVTLLDCSTYAGLPRG